MHHSFEIIYINIYIGCLFTTENVISHDSPVYQLYLFSFRVGTNLYKLRNKVEKERSERIKRQYQLELLKWNNFFPLLSVNFPMQNFTQPLDHFDPEVQVCLVYINATDKCKNVLMLF